MRGNTGNNSAWLRGAAIAAIVTMFPGVAVPAGAATEKVVHAFKGGSDGAGPQAGLLDVKGVLYGTTSAGGTSGDGTVFRVTEGGKEKVLHSFQGGSDGYGPTGGLIEVNGTIYGTNAGGGAYSNCAPTGYCGTLFSITLGGTEKVLHSFGGAGDGTTPLAGLISVKGNLYGTTYFGGDAGCGGFPCGTVFSITPRGTEKVVYVFKGGSDGSNPSANLINIKDTLYGTTFQGGTGSCFGLGGGCGTVFKVTRSGTETVLHTFEAGSDGGNPAAALTYIKGALYGTTSGVSANNSGTVFEINPATGAETVLYSFKGGSDGATPQAGLIDVNGIFYGTTSSGGGSANCSAGCGTVFSILPSGKEKVIHAFSGGSDGADPLAALIDVNGTLYGTTSAGGNGYGTVFSIKP